MFRLSREQVAFIESGVSIVVASRDVQNRPLLGRAAGCFVVPSGQRVTLVVSRRKYPLLLDAIRRSRRIAVSFSEPSSNKSMQIKSSVADVVPARDSDLDRAVAYVDLFAADLERIGHRATIGRTVLEPTPGELERVEFIPELAFVQTPGPIAGTRIDA